VGVGIKNWGGWPAKRGVAVIARSTLPPSRSDMLMIKCMTHQLHCVTGEEERRCLHNCGNAFFVCVCWRDLGSWTFPAQVPPRFPHQIQSMLHLTQPKKCCLGTDGLGVVLSYSALLNTLP
jgi:hypothetical protein